MLFRFGSGANLGFAKKSTDVNREKVRIHVAQGMTAQQWTALSNLVRKRHSWSFRGKAPSESRTSASWHYDIGDAESVTWTITIQVAVRTPQIPQTSFPLKGPRKGVTLRDYWPEAQIYDPEELPQAKQESGPPVVRTAQPGPQPHVTAAISAATGHIESSQNRDRSRSPKGGDEVAATALNDSSQTHDETTDAVKDQQAPAKKLRLTEPGDPAEAVEKFGWRRWDQGGNGDCFFRSASVFLDGKLSTQPKATDSQQKASWIRAQTCQHIKKHSKRFGELFECKQQFDDWVKKAASQTSWADGWTIQAATEKLGCPVVIWNKEGNTYTRFVVAPRYSRGFACGSDNCTPIYVLLESKHYVALVPPPKSSAPKNWLRETPDVIIDLSGGGCQLSLLRLWGLLLFLFPVPLLSELWLGLLPLLPALRETSVVLRLCLLLPLCQSVVLRMSFWVPPLLTLLSRMGGLLRPCPAGALLWMVAGSLWPLLLSGLWCTALPTWHPQLAGQCSSKCDALQ